MEMRQKILGTDILTRRLAVLKVMIIACNVALAASLAILLALYVLMRDCENDARMAGQDPQHCVIFFMFGVVPGIVFFVSIAGIALGLLAYQSQKILFDKEKRNSGIIDL